MKFRVLNEYAIKEYEESLKHIVISIRSPFAAATFLPVNPNRVAEKFMSFHDLDHMPDADKICLGVSKPYLLFTEEQARDVWEFIDRYINDIEMIICNCEAGISRSAGLIAGIKAGMGLDESDIFQKYLPNSLVYRKMFEARQGKMLFQVDGVNFKEGVGTPRRFRKVVKVPGKLINFVTEKRNESDKGTEEVL